MAGSENTGGKFSSLRAERNDLRLISLAARYRKPHYFIQDDLWMLFLTFIADDDQEVEDRLHKFLQEQKWQSYRIMTQEWMIDRGPFGNGIGWRYKVLLLNVAHRVHPCEPLPAHHHPVPALPLSEAA